MKVSLPRTAGIVPRTVPVRVSLLQAVSRLDDELKAASIFRDHAQEEDAQRVLAVAALNALIHFLASQPRWSGRSELKILTVLQSGLIDLDHGKVPAIFTPRHIPKGGARPDRLAASLNGLTAAVMDGLMRYGQMKKWDAAKWVAKRFGVAGHTEVTASGIAAWRKQALERPCAVIGKSYKEWLREELWLKDPLAQAEQLLANVIEVRPKK